TPGGDIELGSGSLLFGRLPECDVHLEDILVSRMHARISVVGDHVVIEDLHSSNGVYVNGLRIGRSVPLREGDRILIGTTEISLFETREASLQRLRVARPVDSDPAERRPLPASAPLHAVIDDEPRASGKPEQRAVALRIASKPDNVPATARTDALKMIGSLADRLAATGNLEEAAQVLSGHLRRILKGANTGLPVPADVAASASHHALTLARWTKQSLWADYVVELHLSARLVMNAVTLAQFEDVTAKLDFDRMLLGYYVEGLKSRQEQLEPDERRRVERLRALTERSR
ncbi:MAG TPA: FHA domain-containing protein, partial [Polyangiaceae bacterium]|nr:FHA domain-containing protein [Polyangiaceae bacterium]